MKRFIILMGLLISTATSSSTFAAPPLPLMSLSAEAQGARIEFRQELAQITFARNEVNSLKFMNGRLVTKPGSSNEARDFNCYVIAKKVFSAPALKPRKVLISWVTKTDHDARSGTDLYRMGLVDHYIESINCRLTPEHATVEGVRRTLGDNYGLISIPTGWEYAN